MYCRNCGTRLPENTRFCSYCGAPQTVGYGQGYGQGYVHRRNNGPLILIAILALLVLIGCFLMLILDRNEPDVSVKADPPATQSYEPAKPAVGVIGPIILPDEKTQPPQDGWHEEGGRRFFFINGQFVIGLQEIDGILYYFYSDGSLAVNTEVEVDGNTLEIDQSGCVVAITYGKIDGDWTGEKYRYGCSGASSVKALDTRVENCDQTGFYIEANGNYGANVSCNWKIYVRSGGTWVFVKEVYYSEPSGTFTIKFDRPMNFDAITAYPTIQGNASYSSYFCLVDVHTKLS